MSAQEAYEAAKREHDAWKRETGSLARAASRDVEASRSEEERRLNRIANEAWQAVRAAENAAVVPHEWEGRKVVMIEPILNRWSSVPTGKFNTKYGVVETWKNDAEMPLNAGWRQKSTRAGDVIVRSIKKDGSPGLAFVHLNQTGLNGAIWELVK
jgi:hypothetical protein